MSKEIIDDFFQEHLRKQAIILGVAFKKLSVTEYILKAENSVTRTNSFLNFTMHVYYQSSVIDLAKLVSENEKTNKFTLKTLINVEGLKKNIRNDDLNKINQLLAGFLTEAKTIVTLRDKFYAHNDFPDDRSIPFSMNEFELVEKSS